MDGVLGDDEYDDTDDAQPDYIEVSLSNPVTVGSGMSKHTNYTTTTKTSFDYYKAKQFSVKRRYNDFVLLQRSLQAKYRDIVMPSLPPAKVSGRFKDSFVRERMSGLEDFINWVAQHPVLRTEKLVRNFLELDQDQLAAEGIQ